MRTLDLANSGQLMLALLPELVLMGGAMLVLLWAGWKRESDDHQRSIGWASLALLVITAGAGYWSSTQIAAAAPRPLATPNFPWVVGGGLLLPRRRPVSLAPDQRLG